MEHDQQLEQFSTTLTSADWTTLEEAGCAFLPAYGQRSTSIKSGKVLNADCEEDVF